MNEPLTPEPTKGSLQAVGRAARLLFRLSEAREPQTLQSLAAHVGCSVSTAHRIVATLLPFGLIERDGATGRLGLGIGITQLANARSERLDLPVIAARVMEDLRQRHLETVTLWVRQGRSACCIAASLGSLEIRQYASVGLVAPLNDLGAKSRTLLAGVSSEELDAVLESAPLHVFAKSAAEMRQEILAINRTGVIRVVPMPGGGVYPDVAAIASPILDASGAIVASLAVAGPNPRFSHAAMDLVEGDLKAAARGLSAQLGFVPPPEQASTGQS